MPGTIGIFSEPIRLASPHTGSALGSVSPDIEQIFDELVAEFVECERAGERVGLTENVAPEVLEVGAALRALFEGNSHLTADLSCEQVYAKALPHFVRILQHMLREQNGA